MRMSTPVAEIVIPAEPGWTLVMATEAKNSPAMLHAIPIIAWLAQFYRRPAGETFVDVIPVTVHGSVDEIQDYALQYAGRPPFFTVHEEFTDEASLLAWFRKSREVA